MGVEASQSIPIIIGGSVAVGALLGLILLGEVLMFHGWFGVILLICGIAAVAADPGVKVEEGGVTATEGIGIANQSPRLSAWIVPALCCAAAYAFYNIFIKKGSASINPILGGVILQIVAALFGSLLLLLITIREGGTSYLNYDAMGVIWSCLAGFAVGAAEMLSFCVSGKLCGHDRSCHLFHGSFLTILFFSFVTSGMGVQASQSIPIVIGGSVAIGAILGLLMLGETLEYSGIMGVVALMVGIGFVATDPGEKMAGH
jgi:transporter family protein